MSRLCFILLALVIIFNPDSTFYLNTPPPPPSSRYYALFTTYEYLLDGVVDVVDVACWCCSASTTGLLVVSSIVTGLTSWLVLTDFVVAVSSCFSLVCSCLIESDDVPSFVDCLVTLSGLSEGSSSTGFDSESVDSFVGCSGCFSASCGCFSSSTSLFGISKLSWTLISSTLCSCSFFST